MSEEKKSHYEKLTEYLYTLPVILDAEGNPAIEEGTPQELFYLMEKSVVWICDRLDELEKSSNKPTLIA